MTVFAVFRSRTQALEADARLRRAGIPVRICATPAYAGCGCGLSCAFDARFHARAARQIGDRYPSFAGYFREGGGRISSV